VSLYISCLGGVLEVSWSVPIKRLFRGRLRAFVVCPYKVLFGGRLRCVLEWTYKALFGRSLSSLFECSWCAVWRASWNLILYLGKCLEDIKVCTFKWSVRHHLANLRGCLYDMLFSMPSCRHYGFSIQCACMEGLRRIYI